MREAAFLLFGGAMIISALLAVTRRNPVHAALWLVLTMLSLAGVYLALGAVFLAMAQIFVYAGAIMVLFLFVVMLVGAPVEELKTPFRKGSLWGVVAAGAVFVAFLTRMPALERVRVVVFEVTARALASPLIGSGGNWGRHALAFELGSVLVVAAILGAILMVRTGREEISEEADDDR
ncbi:MAG: NADH-quinone oxidoreductase subunit J [Candidatus Hydrogenedentota bacterium]|nr:MAG: NADH-quinone oxidoreductase subunit J [Candidatus Hydrogenedentota bacterium]